MHTNCRSSPLAGFSNTARRGRGRGYSAQNSRGGGFSTHISAERLHGDKPLHAGLSARSLQTIIESDLTVTTKSVQLTDIEPLASYNWLDETTPTILIPGSPAIWSNRHLPYEVSPDRGIIITDHHGHRIPRYKLLPLIVAVEEQRDVQKEPFPWESIDIITDRNNLRKLFRWVNNANEEPKDFRIDLHLAGGRTVLMNRWNKREQERGNGYTYGFSFEHASAKYPSSCEGSVSHHRIIRYNMNGLSMVVRFEVDACYPAPKPKGAHKSPTKDVDLEGLVNAMGDTKISAPQNTVASGLNVQKGGTFVPQSSLIELTTRSELRREFYDWKEGYPQLFLSQTAHHILGIHEKGMFKEVQERKLDSPEMRRLQTEFQEQFKKLHGLLQFLQKLVIKHGRSGALSLVCEGHELHVYKRAVQGTCLPNEYLARFDRADAAGPATASGDEL